MIVLVMGAAGAGKTTVGRAFAQAVGWTFFDADDFHDPANIDRMARGIALTDAERLPWLERLRALLLDTAKRGDNVVLACSALKQSYRKVLRVPAPTLIVYLKVDRETLRERLAKRQGHFVKPELLRSQLADLEPPRDGLTLDASQSVDALMAAIKAEVTKLS